MQLSVRIFFLLVLTGIRSVSGQPAKGSDKSENVLAGTTWKVDGVPFETKDRELYLLSTIPENGYESHWGHFITFDETTFSSSYSAPCGNDCFTSVFGSYYFVTATKIHITVKSINRHGFCEKESEELNRNYGYYGLEKTAGGWNLTRTD